MAYTSYPSVAGTSLVGGGSSIAEEYIPLWLMSSGITSSGGKTTSGSAFVTKGTTTAATIVGASVKLCNLSASWNASQLFALEVSGYVGGGTGYVALWDFSLQTPAVVASSQISTSQLSTPSVLRSGSFTLTPGHVYGLTFWTNNASYGYCITKAHLVALMM